jgi:hypothetical protein
MTARARQLIEAATLPTQNHSWGFTGTLLHLARPRVVDDAWDHAAEQLFKLGQTVTPEEVRDFLDSRAGRQLADAISFHLDPARPPTSEELKAAVDAVLKEPWVRKALTNPPRS